MSRLIRAGYKRPTIPANKYKNLFVKRNKDKAGMFDLWYIDSSGGACLVKTFSVDSLDSVEIAGRYWADEYLKHQEYYSETWQL